MLQVTHISYTTSALGQFVFVGAHIKRTGRAIWCSESKGVPTPTPMRTQTILHQSFCRRTVNISKITFQDSLLPLRRDRRPQGSYCCSKQHNEKFIPTIIRKCLAGESIPVYGDGKNIRDWLYVLDHCKGVDLVYHAGKEGNVYNIGGRNERTNLQIVDTICNILDEKFPTTINRTIQHSARNIQRYKDLMVFVKDRAGHDQRYAIDATKLKRELEWKADENFESGIIKTIQWYLNKYGAAND